MRLPEALFHVVCRATIAKRIAQMEKSSYGGLLKLIRPSRANSRRRSHCQSIHYVFLAYRDIQGLNFVFR